MPCRLACLGMGSLLFFSFFSIHYAIKLMLTEMQYIAVQKPIIIISNFKCYQVKRKLDLEDVKLEGFKTPKSCKRRRGSEASPRGNCYFTASFYCIMFFWARNNFGSPTLTEETSCALLMFFFLCLADPMLHFNTYCFTFKSDLKKWSLISKCQQLVK